jgi:chromate transporter
MSLRTGWFTAGELADMVAVAESTPGPIGVNMASYAGYVTGGVPGAVAATLGIISPSVVIILIIARLLDRFRESRVTLAVFDGLRPASAALIASACLALLGTVFGPGIAGTADFTSGVILPAALAAALFVAARVIKTHPVVFIAASAIIGIILEM